MGGDGNCSGQICKLCGKRFGWEDTGPPWLTRSAWPSASRLVLPRSTGPATGALKRPEIHGVHRVGGVLGTVLGIGGGDPMLAVYDQDEELLAANPILIRTSSLSRAELTQAPVTFSKLPQRTGINPIEQRG